MKETCEKLNQLLNKFEYSKYGWHICGDLKVVSLLMGLQLGYMKYCCFFIRMGQPSKDFALPEERLASEKISEGRREECATPSTCRMVQNPATAPKHQTRSDEKLRKSMDRAGSAFKYLAEKFPQLSEAKIKEGVFVGPQIRKLFRDGMFNNLHHGDEKKAWDAFRLVSTNFLGNIRAENYKELVEDIVPQTWLQYVLKDTHASFPLGFVPR
jgi:hypothetical protein